MTYREDFTLPTELMEQVSQQGFDLLPGLIRILVNATMQIKRQKHLRAGRHDLSASLKYGMNNNPD